MSGRHDLELTRVEGDRRLYSLEDVGTLRLEGLFMRAATAAAAADDRTWRFARDGFWQRAIEATDAAGAVVGRFDPGEIRRGGRLRWGESDHTLRPHSLWRERYVLAELDREIALVEARGWWGWGARRPVRMTVAAAAVEPGLLLFVAFVVRAIADTAGTNVGAATVATTSAGG